jgi:MFS family permease
MTVYLVVLLALLNHMSFKGSKVLISLFALELGASEATIGLIYAMYSLFPIVLAVYAGRLADRFGMRGPMLLGSCGLLVGLVLPYAYAGLVTLYLSATLIGIFYIFFIVSMQSLVGTLGPESARAHNYSIYSLGIAASNLLGPLSVGFSIDAFGHADTYRNLAVVPVFAVVWLLAGPKFLPSGSGAPPKSAARPTFSMLRESPDLRRVMLAGGAIETGLELYTFYMPIYGHSVGLSASEIGIVMSVYAAALMVIRVIMPRLVKAYGEHAVLRVSLGAAAALYCVFPFCSSGLVLGMVSFVLGLALGCCSPLSMMLTYNYAPAGRAGEAMGVRQSFNKMTETVAPLAFGVVGAVAGMLTVYWGTAALLAGGSFLARARKGPGD